MFIVDVALEHTCAEFRSRAAEGQITAAERDLLIDGAILLASKIEELLQDGRTGLQTGWPDHGRHEANLATWRRPRRARQSTAAR